MRNTVKTYDESGAERLCPTPQELTLFLSRYSARLIGAGATCIRLEKNVGRIARACGMQAELYITPRHVHISVWEKGATTVNTSIATVNHPCISFNLNTHLSELSWKMADGKISFRDAERIFHHLISADRQNKWLVMILVAFANASFCRLFGGDWIAMAVVWVATLAGYYLKLVLLAKGCDVRAMAIVCSFVSAVLAASDKLFGLGSTPEVAMATSVLYLVPGIPFINAFSDMLYRHYLCAFSRFMDAVVITACLSIGICAAMLLMRMGMF